MALLVAAAASLGCLGPRVVVLPSGPGVTAHPKPSDCKLEFYRTRPDRPFDEIAALSAGTSDTFNSASGDFQEALRVKACELGADAVIVTLDYSGPDKPMNAVAIKYRAAGG